jgi:hypothetical protein
MGGAGNLPAPVGYQPTGTEGTPRKDHVPAGMKDGSPLRRAGCPARQAGSLCYPTPGFRPRFENPLNSFSHPLLITPLFKDILLFASKINNNEYLIYFIDNVINIIHILSMKRLPVYCPSCNGKLGVKRLWCDKCGTEVEGSFPLPPLAGLAQEDQEFVLEFIKASGSLKEMAVILKVSYPTVRNRLDEIIEKLENHKAGQEEKK